MLTDTTLEMAQKIAERIHMTLKNNVVRDCPVTVSIGATTVKPGEEVSERMLLKQADQSLYLTKANGRNQTMVYDPEKFNLDNHNRPEVPRSKN